MRFFNRFLEICGILFRIFAALFLKLFNIVTSLIVMAMNIFVSFNHTWELFKSGGLNGNLALAATIGCELAFIQSSINMIVAGLKRKRPGGPVIFVWIVGTGLVTWSNVSAGWGYGIVGILLGLVPPVLMLGSKSIFSWSVMGMDEGTNEKVRDIAKNTTREVTTASANEDTIEIVTTTNAREVVAAIANTAREVAATSTSIASEETGDAIANEETRETGDAIANEEAQEVAADSTKNTATASATRETGDTIANEETKEVGDDTATSTKDATATIATRKTGDAPRATSASNNKTGDATSANKTGDPGQRHLRLVNDPDLEIVKKVALEIYRNEGKLPGRPRLREETGCTDHKAKKVLQELKEQLGIAS